MLIKRLRQLGPGVIVAAAFIGPGTVTTATLAGAGYGYTLLWAILFSIFATIVLQEMAARLGVISQLGVGEAMRKKVRKQPFRLIVSVLVIGAILIGNAAYEAGNLTGATLGFTDYTLFSYFKPVLVAIGFLAFLLLFSGRYRLIERSLIIMVSGMGLVFLLSAILLAPDFFRILHGLFVPVLPKNSLLMVVGLIGTTVVPYNLFLHASSVKQKWAGKENLSASRWDTIISITGGGLITMAILITSAVAFEGNPQTISGITVLSIQLNPILGSWSSTFMAFGFLAAGLSSSITAPLAAAFATSEILGWPQNLRSTRFRIIWISVLLIGLVFSSLGFKPTAVILFAQVANGLLLPIIAIFLVWIMNDKRIVGDYVNSKTINLLGLLVILVALLLGIKSILSATGLL